MPLPEFEPSGWLPPGHHIVDWEEIEVRFSEGVRRTELFNLLREWGRNVGRLGLRGTLIVNGSFVSAKPAPGDVDCLFIYDEASERVLKDSEKARQVIDYTVCKTMGLGDVFIFAASTVRAYPALCPITLFDFDKNGSPKGVVEVEI